MDKEIKEQIVSIRRRKGRDEKRQQFEIDSDVAAFIRNDLLIRGTFYNDGYTAYFFFREEKRLIEIGRDNIEFIITLGRYGLNSSEKIYGYVLADLYREAFECGQKTEVHRLAYYNQDTFTVYLFNHENQIYRISPDSVELADNGEDGILFLSDSTAIPFEVGVPAQPGSYIDDVIFSKVNLSPDELLPDERRLLLIIFFYAVFFESFMPTKPILAFIGEKGSGKTTTLRMIGILLFGKNFNVTPLTQDPKDFDAAVTNSAYVAFDNADAGYKWLEDKLAIAATGGSVKKRELYTTNRLVNFPIHCFIGITSRTPEYRRDDVADRLLIMKVERLKGFISERILLSGVMDSRNKIMSEVVSHLLEIVRALKSHGQVIESISFRMADFARFATVLAQYAGIEEKVKIIFEKLSTEQFEFANEGDPIEDLLLKWASIPQNQGREVSANTLNKELAELAEKEGMAFPYKGNVQGFAQRLNNLWSHLGSNFESTKREGKSRKKLYSFKPRKEETDK